MAIGKTDFVQACPSGTQYCTGYDITLDSISPPSNGNVDVKFSYVRLGVSYIEEIEVDVAVNGSIEWSNNLIFPTSKSSKTVSVPASVGDTIRLHESLTNTNGLRDIGVNGGTKINTDITGTVPPPPIQNVTVSSYTVQVGTNSATPKLTVDNPNNVSVSFKSKVTVDGVDKTTKTIAIPANSTGEVSYSLSFNVSAGASESHNICIVPVSTGS